MAIIKAKGRQTSAVSSESEGSDVYLRAMRDGSLIGVPWVQAKAIEGKVFCAQTGLMTGDTTFSPVVVGDMPDLSVSVPTGTTIIPIYISVGFEDTGSQLAIDVFAVASKVYDQTGLTSTPLTITNLRTDKATGGSQCIADAVTTGNGSDLEASNTNYIEFWRPLAGFGEDAYNCDTMPTNNQISYSKWTIGNAVVPPIIVGTSTLGIFAGSQAGKGFITAMWVEENTADLL